MRSSRGLFLAAALLAACRSVPPAELPSGWGALAGEPAPTVALYRLRCCGRSDLLATVRSGGGVFSLSVSAMPGGVLMEGWHDGAVTWVHEARGDCRSQLPAGRLPLGRGDLVPLDPHLAALALAGRVPEGARPLAGAPGWVAARVGEWWVRARVSGEPPRCEEMVVGIPGADGALVAVEQARHLGTVPGRILVSAGRTEAELVLLERRDAVQPAPPVWLGLPECGAGS